jgi:hypothetical protein
VTLSGEELQCVAHGCGSLGGVTGPIMRPNRARIGSSYTGWYLFALDAHLGNTYSGLVGYPSPAAIPPWPTNATVIRSGPYGPVTGPPVPRVRFLAHAQVHGDEATVAAVRCAVRCHVWVTVSLTAKRIASGRRVAWSASKVFTGTATMAVRGRIPRGPVAVTINVGDGPYLHGRSLVR